MAISKIILNGVTQIDLTQDTVAANNLISPNTAHGADGEPIIGTASSGSTPTLQIKNVSYTPTTSQQTDQVTPDSGYDGLNKVNVTISAIPTGTAGTPSASKGAVSNNSINITPSVTNTTGYITGGTKTGTAVSVSASELVSGTKSISANGTGIDVTNYASVDVTVPVGSDPVIDTLIVTPSQSKQVFNSSNLDGYKPVTVEAISSTYVGTGIARKSSTDLTTSGATVTAPAGYYATAASKSIASGSATTPATTVSVTPGISVNSSGLITATASGTKSITPTISAGYISSGTAGTVTVDGSNTSQLSTQSGTTITPTESLQTAVAAGKYTTGAVNIAAIPNDYVGSGITQRSSSNLSVSGATVTAPAGYYSTAASTSVASGTVTAPSSISGTSATVSTGTNTLTLSKTVSVTPNVTTAGYISSGTAGNSSVSLTASVTTKAAATIHPSTSQQSVASGTYLTGAQTISAVTTANLAASNIISGVTIKVGDSSDDDCVASVTGNVVLQSYYTGSSAPTSGTGSDGDLYLQTT